MVDMVVHRHKLKETLARVCRLLMAGVELGRAADTGKSASRKLNGKGTYTNGASPDMKTNGKAAGDTKPGATGDMGAKSVRTMPATQGVLPLKDKPQS
jgi:hypothetical protein